MTTKVSSRLIGALFLAGFIVYGVGFGLVTVISIPIGFLYSAVLKDPNYIVGTGTDTAVIIGGILEMIVALAGIGTAVVLFPILKYQNEAVALGFVGTRVLEASTIFADVVCLMAIVTLRRAGVGADALVTGKMLVALYGLFRLGQNLMPAVNDLFWAPCFISRAWCRVFFPCLESSERPCSSLTPSFLCSASPAGRSMC